MVFIYKRKLTSADKPRRGGRGRGSNPTVVIDRSIADHLEVLGVALGRSGGIRLVKGVGHADAFDRLLLYPVDYLQRLDASSFEDCGHYIDDMVKLGTNTTEVLDVAGP